MTEIMLFKIPQRQPNVFNIKEINVSTNQSLLLL